MKKGIIDTLIGLQAAFVLLLVSRCTSTDSPSNNAHKIIVEAKINKHFHRDLTEIFTIKDQIDLHYTFFPRNQIQYSSETVTGRVTNGTVKWVLYSTDPIRVSPPFGASIIMHPGDSLHIHYQRDNPEYSGNNMNALALLDTLMLFDQRLLKPRLKHSYGAYYLADFLEWNQYLDNKLAMQLPVVESYKDKVIPAEYEFYKSELVGNIESQRLDAFCALYRSRKHLGTTNEDLIRIWDSTQNNSSRQWLQSLASYNGSIYDIYTFAWMSLYRQVGFDTTHNFYRSKEIYTSTLYNRAKNNYKGQVRERLMAHILDEPTITEMGLKNPTTQTLLKDYYSQPGYPEYKAWVKQLERKRQQRELDKEKRNKEKEKQQAGL